MKMGYWNGFAPYVSVAERKTKARKQFEKLNKRGDFEPIRISGRKIASSWWGKCWVENLERYADYANRIGRGRSYVRNEMVLDLKIGEREVSALVAGSRSKPYRVVVSVESIRAATWKALMLRSSECIESVGELLKGEFPHELKDVFFGQKTGLFPSPSEITFSCSCPDWASMCKHVAAALYGIGARFDTAPELFFSLRGACMDELIGAAAQKETERLLDRKTRGSDRLLTGENENDDLEALFGISIAGGQMENAPGTDTGELGSMIAGSGDHFSNGRGIGRKKSPAKKPAAKKPTAKRSVPKKPVAKKSVAKKPVAKKPVPKKPVPKKPTVKKSTVKKSAVKKPTAKKASAKKSSAKRRK